MNDHIVKDQEVEDKDIDLLELVKTVWKKRKTLAIWCICGFVAGIVIS